MPAAVLRGGFQRRTIAPRAIAVLGLVLALGAAPSRGSVPPNGASAAEPAISPFSPLSALAPGVAAPRATVPVAIGTSVVALNGPWKFHTGDDARWADPRFDDAGWESVDLTPRPGAHDSDVGLTGYVPGWMARGHANYWGYAWYRMRVSLTAPPGEPLAVAGPLYVDSAYQLFVDGRLMGGYGDFSRREPAVYSRRPLVFPLPRMQSAGAGGVVAVVAIRTWMGRGAGAGGPDGGGIHIAPALGEADGIEARRQQQWIEIVRGYAVDAAEPVALLLVAVLAWSLAGFERAGGADPADPADRSDPANLACRWMIAALLLTAAVRANQPLFFWTHWEDLTVFDLVRNVLLTPLVLGAWAMAWRAWFRVGRPAWLPACTAALTLLYIAAQLLTRPWLATLPRPAAAGLHFFVLGLRLLFVLLFVLLLAQGIRHPARGRWLSVLAALAVAVAVFAQELSAIGVPGIWFPWGTGVSRTEYALAVLTVLLAALLLHRLRDHARGRVQPVEAGRG